MCARIKPWLKNVVKMNFNENWINYIILDNCTMHYKRKITNCKSSLILMLLYYSISTFRRQMADVQKRRLELLNEIKRKERRSEHFVKDKQDTVNLVRRKNKRFSFHLFVNLVSNNCEIFTRYSCISSRNQGEFRSKSQESRITFEYFGNQSQATRQSTSFAIITSNMTCLSFWRV